MRVGLALRGLDGPGLGQLMHRPGQLLDGLGQLVLVLGQLMLDLGQLLVLSRDRPPGQPDQLVLVLGQLILVLGQLILDHAERLRQQRGRKLDTADGGSARDLRYGRRPVLGRTFEKDVGADGQHGAGQEKQPTVQRGEPQPGRAAGPP